MSERDWKIFRENNDILIKGGRVPVPIRNWDDIEDLPSIVKNNLEENSYFDPTPIQM